MHKTSGILHKLKQAFGRSLFDLLNLKTLSNIVIKFLSIIYHVLTVVLWVFEDERHIFNYFSADESQSEVLIPWHLKDKQYHLL